jgi:Flp pilus assembly protein TadD
MLGETHYKLGAFGEAIGAFEKVLKINSKDADALVRIAECNMHLDLFDGARTAISRALEVNPNHREAQYLSQHLGEMTTPHKPGF